MEPREGGLLGDRYEVGSIIGVGGMGRVHEGRDRVLDRAVAVKVLDATHAGESRFVESFRSEARAAAALHHPSVVSVFDSGSEGDLHYIVMERLRGRTLREVISAEGPLDPERARRIAAGIAAALAEAHERGFVHRDVKPGNVMVCADDAVKVMDFGIARAAGEERRTASMILGTAAYLAPEQAQGRTVGPAADVYALGCVLYEMLTGRPPFEGANAVTTAYAHVHEPPVPPGSVRDGVPSDLERIVLRCLAKHPRRRYRSARELEAALVAAGAGTAVELPAPERDAGPSTQPMPIFSRRRVPVGALGLGAILLVGFLLSPSMTATGPGPTPDRAEASTRVEVPGVVGMTEREAAEALVEAGLVPRLVDGAVDDGVEDVVIEQRPAAGARADRGSFVTLRLSPTQPEEPGDQGSGEKVEAPANDDAGDRGEPDEAERPSREDGGGGGGEEEPEPVPSPSPSPEPTPTSTPTPTPTAMATPADQSLLA